MELKNIMCDNSILIVPKNSKEKMIQAISSLPSFYAYKIIDDASLKESLFFSYDMNAIHYLVKKYNYKPENAIQYIESMYYIQDKNYQNPTLNFIRDLKKELIQNHLLKQDTYFKNTLKNKKIIVYGFDTISKEMLYILSQIEQDYQIISNDEQESKIQSVYHFETLEDEVEALCLEISKLLQKNVDINQIKIANVNQDYLFTLKRYFDFYHIPCNFHETTTLYTILCVQEFYKSCLQYQDYEKALNEFHDLYSYEIELYKTLVNIVNQVITLPFDDSLVLLKYLLKNGKKPSKSLKKAVEIISLDHYFASEDEYLFVLSVNQGIYPKNFKDEDFLSDQEKMELHIDTSEDLNKLSKQNFHCLLKKKAHIQLSYKEKTPFSSFTKSFVLFEENIMDVNYQKDIFISYSSEADELLLAKKYDSIYQATEDEEIAVLSSQYDIDYKKYDHSFQSFDSQKIKDHIQEKNKKISYSAISNYFACSFKYYLANLLDLSKDIKSRSIDIGNVFHKVLELSKEKDFDFDSVYQKQLENIEDIVTLFYLDKFKSMLKDIIAINQDNLNHSFLDHVLTEKKVAVEYKEPIDIVFKGYIDKILYTIKENKTYVAIIDYKTGDPEINVDKVKYGLSLQLPIYLYLIKHTCEFQNVEVCGFYLQKLLPKQMKADKDYYQTIKETIAYQGYSNASKAILSMFDPSFENSTMIKSMKTNKDGSFYRFAKVLTSEEMDEIANLVEDKVKEAIEKISQCEFDINPKILNGKNQSCKFCEFKECCYMTHNDFVYLDGNQLEMEGDEDGN